MLQSCLTSFPGASSALRLVRLEIVHRTISFGQARTASQGSMSSTMTAELVTNALMMAIWRRGKSDALLHHSDRGSQYTSDQFQRLMADHGVSCSMSRAGNVWDNAAMESFFSSLKTERTTRKTYRTRNEAKADVFDYIERFYNPHRRHSTLGYLSPADFEKEAERG
jgi:putative transposase